MAGTYKSIADLTGESVAAVRAVLDGTAMAKKIPDTRQARIRRAAAEHGFRPGMQSQVMRLRRSAVVGVVVPEVGIPFFASLVGALEHELFSRNYQLMICASRDDPAIEQQLVDSLMSRGLDALIIATASQEPPRGVDVPMVFVDRDLPGDDHLAVVSDHRGGAEAAMRHLIASGSERIALVSGIPGISTYDLRREAYLTQLAAAGRSPDAGYQALGATDRQSAKKQTLAMLKNCSEPPDAIFVVSYYFFEGVLDALVAHYGAIPSDVHLATFDDHPLVDYLPTPVLSVRQDTNALAHAAIELLFASMHGQAPNAIRQVVPVHVITRD